MAKQYRCRPSELLAVEDPLAAYCVDRAVSVFGNAVESDVEQATDGKKKEMAQVIAQNVVAKWTGGRMRFADPVPTR